MPRSSKVKERPPKIKISAQEYASRRSQILAELGAIEEREKEYRDTNRIEFFKPFYYQQKILDHLKNGKKTLVLQGANQIGKTVLGACIVGSAALGIQPWDSKPTIWGQRPLRIRIICSDWEHHAREVIVPELKHWMPAGTYETQKNNVGIEAFWTFPSTGSTLELMTHIQVTQIHERWKKHLVWADEPLPRDKYVANKRGLIANDGVFLLTMTAVTESWILDEIILSEDPQVASVTEIPIRDNPTLTEEAIQSFESTLRDEEKVARIEGGWLNLVGLVWKGFSPDVHIIDPFTVPTDWPVIPQIDFHPTIPNAIAFYALDPLNQQYVVDEVWKHLSPEDTADEIIRRKVTNAWRIEDVFIDPLSKGDTQYIKNRGVEIRDAYSVINDRLSAHGIDLHVATKDKNSGILNVERMLKGPNGRPTLFFLRSLVNSIPREGHVWEIRRWTYREGKPKDEDDHFMECLYRSTLTGIVYTEPNRYRDGKRLVVERDFSVFQPNYGIESNVFGGTYAA